MNDHSVLALREFEAKHYRLAVQFSERALAEQPEDASALEILGLASLQLGAIEVGVDALEELTLLRPLTDACQIELAIAYGCLGHHRLSCDLLMGIAVSGRPSSEQLLRIAAGLEAVGQARLAMEACRQAGVVSPECPNVHFQMGYYAQICGRPDSMVEALIRHAIHLDPVNLHYRIGLSSLLIRLGRKCEAITVIDHLIPDRLNEVTCECCLKRIANLFFDCDDLDRARQCGERLANLQTQNATSPPVASMTSNHE
ncbi:MAG: hypothetical protein AAF958_14565 [Planctomycetota bacterium]